MKRRRQKVPTIAEAVGGACFEVLCVYRGLGGELDEKLEKLAKREIDGSGTDWSDEIRDLSFEFKTEAQAVAAAKRIKAARLPVRVLIRGFRSP